MSNQVFWNDVFGLNAQNDLRMAKKDMLWQTFVADFLPKRVKMADFLPKIVADFFMAEKK